MIKTFLVGVSKVNLCLIIYLKGKNNAEYNLHYFVEGLQL